MTPAAFRLDGRRLAALARGGGGAAAVRLLGDSEYSRRLLLLRAVLDRAGECGGDSQTAVNRLFGVLSDARRTAPDVTRRILGHPSVGPRLVTTWRALDTSAPATADPLPLAEVAAASALATGLDTSIGLTAVRPGAVLPGLGAARLPDTAPGTALLLRGNRAGSVLETGTGLRVDLPPMTALRAEHADWWPLRSATAEPQACLLIDDVDQAVATGAERPYRLPADELRTWRSMAAAAMRLLRARHAEYAAELDAGLRTLTPVPLAEGARARHSASAAEMFGGVTLSRPAHARDLAETLVHEMQHSKLAAVMHLVDLLAEPGATEPGARYYAPWRDDPRPLYGLLHGTYAFLAVARFWSREAAVVSDPAQRHRAYVRCARWREAASETNEAMLADGSELTDTGRRFVATMGGSLAELCAVPLPRSAVREARRQAEAHRARWTERNGAGGPES
ncbi:radical SAM domain-containing protein [Streptomyces viridochromogenes DSM 40736]|uniref:Radical SAM domain-containing protein n=1 Tax=Streptomyces viridochromogenes (strain DSM 40736 / JCM 4977 / BCRC 1201 / Tue 494) TaxID=591159 RepID=D9WZD7_STRVT|nr:HEXXH motif domain-containing protein [Streptomyces viridochromogenes]EFL35440.1 radical SAM domain-containing protein [Streptomyces viridochromogenes DSM 40736]